jgi:xanthosine utilization system XapX-like protein
MTAPRTFRGFTNRTWHEGSGVDVLLGQLDDLVSIVGLLFVTAYFRDATSTTWQVPDTAWIFISLGLGLAVGALIFAMLRVPASDPEFLAIMLGGIAFASGLAGYLHLSPIVVCFLAGTLVTNFPNDQRESVFRILTHLERPVHLLFLIIVGAIWDVGDWRGWVLVPLFVAGRAIGKWTGVIAAKTAVGALLPSGFADQRALITPMSGLSIALVISVDNLHADPGLPWIITAVVGGSLVTEILIHRERASAVPEPVGEQSTQRATTPGAPT